jgi:hypothetical protein
VEKGWVEDLRARWQEGTRAASERLGGLVDQGEAVQRCKSERSTCAKVQR